MMSDWLCITDAYDFIHIEVVMQNKLINVVDGYMDWLLFVTKMEIAESVTVREIVDCVTDHEGDCWLCHRHCGRLLSVLLIMRVADCVTDHQVDSWLCHRQCERLLFVLQTKRETADSVTDIVGDSCLCYWMCHIKCARLLTVLQTMREIADCVRRWWWLFTV